MNMTWMSRKTVGPQTSGLHVGAALGGKWLLALGLAFTALAASATDDPPGRVGRVGDTVGQVWTMEAGQGEWLNLQRNQPITTGDRITTDQRGRVELQVGSTTFRLGEHTDVQVMRLDDERIQLQLAEGSLTVRLREPEVVGEVEVLTDEGRFTPRTTGFFRVDNSPRAALAEVVNGELLFEGHGTALSLRGGQRAEFWVEPSDHAMHYSWAPPANDELQRWARDEDLRQDRREYGRYVSPEMTGADDLDRYGQWTTTAEYGVVWAPTVDTAWAPYRYGHWAWVRPWGWTWVDDAPWGFAPFHYGRWVYFGGRWCWSPGHREHRPVYSPALVAWVGGNGVSATLRVGGGPGVGWIPLAPREPYYPVYRTSPDYIVAINRNHALLPRDPDRGQHPPISYTNRGVPGGITVVSAQALQQRQPVAVASQRAPDDVVQRQWRGERNGGLTAVAPPMPQGAQLAPRVVPAPNLVREVPRPGGDRWPGRDNRPGPALHTDGAPAVMQAPQTSPGRIQPAQPQLAQPQPAQVPQAPGRSDANNGWRFQANPALGGNPAGRDGGFQRPPVAPVVQQPTAPQQVVPQPAPEAPRGFVPREALPPRPSAMEPRPQQADPQPRGERRMPAPVVMEQPRPQQPQAPRPAPQAAPREAAKEPAKAVERSPGNRADRRDLN